MKSQDKSSNLGKRRREAAPSKAKRGPGAPKEKRQKLTGERSTRKNTSDEDYSSRLATRDEDGSSKNNQAESAEEDSFEHDSDDEGSREKR